MAPIILPRGSLAPFVVLGKMAVVVVAQGGGMARLLGSCESEYVVLGR